MQKQVKKRKSLFWWPRILTILFITFISLFSLDVFSMGLGVLQTIGALLIHLIPSFILIAILVFFWRKSKILGYMWVAFGIGYIIMIMPNLLKDFQFYYLSWMIQFSGAAFIIAYLFFRDKEINR